MTGAPPLEATHAALVARARSAPGAAGFFPAMYATVTAAVLHGCATGRFADPPRMARFVDAFAGYYLRACRTPSRSWKASFDVAEDRRLLVVQHLLLGINAHVNLDLPQTVAGLARTEQELHALRADFDAVNDVLAETFTDVSARLNRVAGWTRTALELGGGSAFNFSLRVARDQAWRTAVRLHAAPEARRPALVTELDELVTVLAYLVTRPSPPLSLAVPLLRRCEQPDPRRVVRALLATGQEQR